MKLITSQRHRFGRVQTLPVVGDIQISEEGIIEVESSTDAESIVNLGIGFEFLKGEESREVKTKVEEIKPKIEKAEPLKEEALVEEIKPNVEEVETLGSNVSETVINEASIINTEVVKSESDMEESSSVEVVEEKSPTEMLSEMKVSELHTMAAPFPKTEWQSLKKEKLVEYLVSKL